jgi:hypothetical protein
MSTHQGQKTRIAQILVIVFGLSVLAGAYYVFSMVYLEATFNGIRTGHWVVSFNTNAFGEGWPEFLLFLVSFPSVCFAFANYISMLRPIIKRKGGRLAT